MIKLAVGMMQMFTYSCGGNKIVTTIDPRMTRHFHSLPRPGECHISLETDTLSSCSNPKEKFHEPVSRKTGLEDDNKGRGSDGWRLGKSSEDEIQSREVVP